MTAVNKSTVPRKKAPTWQTGTFHVELAQLMAEAIWGKASCCPTVAH